MSIREWYYMQRNKQKHEEDGETMGGRLAERYIKEKVEHRFTFKNAYCFQGKRIPYKTTERSGKREIDLLVVTPKMIHIIEVKNWGGEIRDEGDKWHQIRKFKGDVVHDNPTIMNQEKMHVLKGYLDKNKCLLPQNPLRYFSQKVILMNENAILDCTIRSNPNVIVAKKLEGYVSGMKTDILLSRMFKSIITKCLDAEASIQVCDGLLDSLSPQTYQQIISLLDQLGTWDSLILYGGKRINGDFLHFCFFDGNSEQKITRHQLNHKTSFLWHRSHWWLLMQFFCPIGIFSSKTSRFEIHLSRDVGQKFSLGHILFHSAGQKTPENFNLIDVDTLELGY
jgi:hypothetical protein